MGAEDFDERTAISDLEIELRREEPAMPLPSDSQFLAQALAELGVEEVVTAVGKLDSEKQRQVTNALISRRHGLPTRVSRELVPYDKEKETALVQSLDFFKTQINEYRSKCNFNRSQRQNLEVLAEAGILDQTGTKMYLDATERVHQTLGESALSSVKDNHKSFCGKQKGYSAIGMVMGLISLSVSPVGLGVVAGSLAWYVRSTWKSDEVIDKEPITDPNKLARYRRSLINQLERHPTLSEDILIAIDYGTQLQEQLQNPEQISKEYDARMAEVIARIPQAQQHLQKLHELYLELQ